MRIKNQTNIFFGRVKSGSILQKHRSRRILAGGRAAARIDPGVRFHKISYPFRAASETSVCRGGIAEVFYTGYTWGGALMNNIAASAPGGGGKYMKVFVIVPNFVKLICLGA